MATIAVMDIKIRVIDEATEELAKVDKQAKKTGSGVLKMVPGFSMFGRISKFATGIAKKGFWAYTKSVFKATLATIKLGIATAIALWPIIVIIAAIIAIIIIALIVWQNWGTIAEWLGNVWKGFIEYLQNAWNSLVEFGLSIFNAFKDFFTGLWKGIVKFVTGIWSFLKTNWKVFLDIFLLIATGGLYLLFMAWRSNLGGIQDFTKGLFDWLTKLWGALIAASKGDWSQLGKVIVGIVKYIVGFVIGLFKKMYNFIKDIPIIGDIAKGVVGILKSTGVKIPGFRTGIEYLHRTQLLVGHPGELIMRASEAGALRRAGGFGGGGNITFGDIKVYVEGGISSELDIDNLFRKLKDRLLDELRSQYR